MKISVARSTSFVALLCALLLVRGSSRAGLIVTGLIQSPKLVEPQLAALSQGTNVNSETSPDNETIKPPKKSFFLNVRFVESFFSNVLSIFVTDPDTLRISAKAASWITWAFFILSALGTFGFDTKPLLSLLSVSGLTIGFAAKDILTNLFKGFFILLTKPFKRGWIISVNGFRGKVLSIDSRFVKLQSFIDKSEILVPLSMIYDTAIVIERKGDI